MYDNFSIPFSKWLTLPQPVIVEDSVEVSVAVDVVAVEVVAADVVVAVVERRGDKEWVPVTKLGRLVKEMKIKKLEEIYLFSLPIKVGVVQLPR